MAGITEKLSTKLGKQVQEYFLWKWIFTEKKLKSRYSVISDSCLNENLIHNIIHASFHQETNHHLSPKGGGGEGFWLCHDRFYLIPVTTLLNLRTLNKAVKQR